MLALKNVCRSLFSQTYNSFCWWEKCIASLHIICTHFHIVGHVYSYQFNSIALFTVEMNPIHFDSMNTKTQWMICSKHLRCVNKKSNIEWGNKIDRLVEATILYKYTKHAHTCSFTQIANEIEVLFEVYVFHVNSRFYARHTQNAIYFVAAIISCIEQFRAFVSKTNEV